MNLEDYFPKDELESWKNLFHEFHGKLLIDDKLTDSEVLLISVYMCCNKEQKAEISYYEAKDTFLKFGRKGQNFYVNMGLLKKRGLIDEEARKETRFLSLTIEGLKATKALITDTVGTSTWFIESGKAFSGKKLFKEIVLSAVGSYMKICDPYCGVRILDLLSEISENCKISLLTQTVEKEAQFKRELADFKKELPNIDIEVRIFATNKLHDRYIITESTCWSIGSSLKDLGNKDTLVTKLTDEIRQAIEETFEARWKISNPIA
jgi:hypothetical protein